MRSELFHEFHCIYNCKISTWFFVLWRTCFNSYMGTAYVCLTLPLLLLLTTDLPSTIQGSQTQTFFHSIQPCTSSLSPPVNPADAPSLNTKISPQNLVGEVLSDTGWPIGSRGFANIYRTTWFHNGKETRVSRYLLVHLFPT